MAGGELFHSVFSISNPLKGGDIEQRIAFVCKGYCTLPDHNT